MTEVSRIEGFVPNSSTLIQDLDEEEKQIMRRIDPAPVREFLADNP